MKKNLQRLNFKKNITVKNILKIKDKKKYDIVLLDAPCTSVGTIRRNPEIFYRKTIPDFKKIISIQNNLLDKAKLIVKKNGVIYAKFLMVRANKYYNYSSSSLNSLDHFSEKYHGNKQLI